MGQPPLEKFIEEIGMPYSLFDGDILLS